MLNSNTRLKPSHINIIFYICTTNRKTSRLLCEGSVKFQRCVEEQIMKRFYRFPLAEGLVLLYKYLPLPSNAQRLKFAAKDTISCFDTIRINNKTSSSAKQVETPTEHIHACWSSEAPFTAAGLDRVDLLCPLKVCYF